LAVNSDNGTTTAASVGGNALQATYTLNVVIVAPNGVGEVFSNPGAIECFDGMGTCSDTFTQGTSVTLFVGAGDFNFWNGSCSGTGNCTLVMDSNKIAQARFGNNGNPKE